MTPEGKNYNYEIYIDLKHAEQLGKTLIAVPIKNWKYCEKLRIENPKLKMKLKMMEISFEQINNSRNDLLRQLAECESTLESVLREVKMEKI